MSSLFVVSDLHITDEQMDVFSGINADATRSFLCEHIQQDDLLVICGDLIDKGGYYANSKKTEATMKNALSVMGDLCSLDCPVLFVPGNHDIADDKIKIVGKDERQGNKYDRINRILKETRKHHNTLLETTIATKKVIVSHFVLGNTLLIGLNSTCQIGRGHESGFIDTEELEKELKALKKAEKQFDKLNKIAIVHHNFFPYGDTLVEKNSYNREGHNGNLQNADDVRKLLDSYAITTYIMGHEHGNQSKIDYDILNSKQYNYYIVDSLAGNGSKSITMSEFVLSEEGQISCIKVYAFVQTSGFRGVWTMPHCKNIDTSLRSNATPFERAGMTDLSGDEKRTKPIDRRKEAEKYLYDRIREKNLLKTGHFCYNGNCSLTWIDTTPFISSAYRLDRICWYFNVLYKTELENADVYLGLGIKGTIIANAMSTYRLNTKVVYYPDDNDIDKNETKFFTEELGKPEIKKIVLFTDVCSSRNTRNNFIERYKNIIADKELITLCIIDRIETVGVEESNNIDGVYSLCRIPQVSCGKVKAVCPLFRSHLCEIIGDSL